MAIVSTGGGVARPASAGGSARAASPQILVRATVADRARSVMPPALWSSFVGAYAGSASRPLPDDTDPDAAGCRKAGGDYLIDAAFDLRDDLPGLANASDRFAGRTRLVVVACADARALVDRSLRLDGEPVAIDAAVTPETLASAWHDTVPAALARAGVAIGHVARARRLDGGGGSYHIDFALGSAPVGALVSDTTMPNHAARRPPLLLTIAKVERTGAEALFVPTKDTDPVPSATDFIEYVAGRPHNSFACHPGG